MGYVFEKLGTLVVNGNIFRGAAKLRQKPEDFIEADTDTCGMSHENTEFVINTIIKLVALMKPRARLKLVRFEFENGESVEWPRLNTKDEANDAG